MEFPKDKGGFEIDDQFFIGSSGLLVKPITENGARETKVYIPEDQVYYNYFTHQTYLGSSKGKHVTIPADLHEIPLLIRGGSIIPTKERPRRSSAAMKFDPYTLQIALSKSGAAKGELYVDGGDGYGFKDGEFVWRSFVASKSKKEVRIESKDLGKEHVGKVIEADTGKILETYNPENSFAKSIPDVRVERVIVVGLGAKPTSVKSGDGSGQELVWEFTPGVASSDKKEGIASILNIKDPRVLITKDWSIVIQL